MTSDFELIMRYASENGYIHDPEHTQHPPSGYHKTEKGWSEGEGEEEHDWTDEEHNKMLDRLYHHVGDKEVMKKWLSKK
jgi:hypothetical protein